MDKDYLKKAEAAQCDGRLAGIGQPCRQATIGEMLHNRAEALRDAAYKLEATARSLPPEVASQSGGALWDIFANGIHKPVY